jgi:tRNA threonylcarbamoyladenosine biosynthesis protein TsaE
MIVHRTHSAVETEALGEQLGRSLPIGTVLGLSGDLGAGKTAFVRGLARGLGCGGRVHSPTFALLNQYEGGRLPLYHLDLYRLNGPEDVRGAGLEEYLVRPRGVSAVEWIERWCDDGQMEMVAGMALHRILFRSIDETTREISYEDLGI